MKRKKFVLGMSGGTDSAVAAYLLKSMGHEVTGITFSLWDEASRCCNLNDIMDAKETAAKTGMRHFTVNMKKEFKELVVDDFIGTYLAGMTPNPCAVCNAAVKMSGLYKKMLELGYDYIATGHYAYVKSSKNGVILKPALDDTKSQEYFLSRVNPKILEKCFFPLSGMQKTEVKALAKRLGLVREKPESQEACFLKENETPFDFIKRLGAEPRNARGAELILNSIGKKYTLPYPYYRYTVGQRKGLGIGGEAGREGGLYISGVSADNKVYAGTRQEASVKEFKATGLNILYNLKCFKEGPFRAMVKVRYRSKAVSASASINNNVLNISLDEPQFAVAPGQVAAVYIKGRLVMSGIITRPE